jgi:predicted RNA-binding Zn-ribbon protein involved in translation (DUF1610 family)
MEFNTILTRRIKIWRIIYLLSFVSGVALFSLGFFQKDGFYFFNSGFLLFVAGIIIIVKMHLWKVRYCPNCGKFALSHTKTERVRSGRVKRQLISGTRRVDIEAIDVKKVYKCVNCGYEVQRKSEGELQLN